MKIVRIAGTAALLVLTLTGCLAAGQVTSKISICSGGICKYQMTTTDKHGNQSTATVDKATYQACQRWQRYPDCAGSGS